MKSSLKRWSKISWSRVLRKKQSNGALATMEKYVIKRLVRYHAHIQSSICIRNCLSPNLCTYWWNSLGILIILSSPILLILPANCFCIYPQTKRTSLNLLPNHILIIIVSQKIFSFLTDPYTSSRRWRCQPLGKTGLGWDISIAVVEVELVDLEHFVGHHNHLFFGMLWG